MFRPFLAHSRPTISRWPSYLQSPRFQPRRIMEQATIRKWGTWISKALGATNPQIMVQLALRLLILVLKIIQNDWSKRMCTCCIMKQFFSKHLLGARNHWFTKLSVDLYTLWANPHRSHTSLAFVYSTNYSWSQCLFAKSSEFVQIWGFPHCKPSILGYPHSWKPSYLWKLILAMGDSSQWILGETGGIPSRIEDPVCTFHGNWCPRRANGTPWSKPT